MRIWKERIDPELIDMFLDRLFQECKNSIYDFERVLADYGLENIVFSEDCDEDCQVLKDLEDDIEDLKLSEKKLKASEEEAKHNSIRNNKLYLDIKEKYNKLKKNSVLFTMDDEGF